MPIDVAEWLRDLGLEQYAPAFVDNDIDGDVLAELTAEDLTGLGVTSIGHRRRLLSATIRLPVPGCTLMSPTLKVKPKPVWKLLSANPVAGSISVIRSLPRATNSVCRNAS